MRPSISRALTAALATVGTAGAFVLPTLTLGDAKTPPHAFAIPMPGGSVVIRSSPVGTPTRAHPARPEPRSTAPEPAPSTARAVAPVTRNLARATTLRPARPAPRPVRIAVAKQLPAPSVPAAPTPEAVPTPQPEPAPEPMAVRILASVAEQPADQPAPESSKKHTQRKDKARNDKPKHEKPAVLADPASLTPPVPESQTDLAPTPLEEPLPVAGGEQVENGEAKEHGHGKAYGKKK